MDDRLANVQIGAFSAVSQALTDLPVDTDVRAMAARIRAAIPFGVAFPGSPFDLAQAITQTLGSPVSRLRIGSFTPEQVGELTEAWNSYPWRILPERNLSAAMNVAVDEVLSNEVSRGESPPCLRFWKWAESGVIIGRCQSVRNEVDREAMAERGVTLVRRLTGGGAMFVQPQGTITYSLILPEVAVAGLSIRQSYEICDAWVVAALRTLGVDAHHVQVNDIAWAGGKIGGAAQARRRGIVLHHTTLAYELDNTEMARILRIGRQKLKANAVASAPKVVSPLCDQVATPREEIVAAMIEQFHRQYGGTPDELLPGELAEAEELVRTKYSHPDWTEEFD